MSRQTFDYRAHNVCGGQTTSPVTQGPRRILAPSFRNGVPTAADGLITPPPPPEAKYVRGPMGAATWLANARWLRQLKQREAHAESTEGWLRRHKIGLYAS